MTLDAQTRAALQAQLDNGGAPATPSAAPAVTFGQKGELILPAVPGAQDTAGLAAWLTCVYNLDPGHPIVGGAREGLRGAAGHAVLVRRGAPDMRHEPVSRVNNPPRLVEDIAWQTTPSDGAVHAFKAGHCRDIALAIRRLCGTTRALSDKAETASLVAAALDETVAVEGHTTFGTSGERYEAASALQRDLDDHTGRPIGPPRHLIDRNTGEVVIRVRDLAESVRRQLGSSLSRGWLDGRLDGLGWARVELQGFALPGRTGRTGPHARCDVFRGVLTRRDDDQSVNT